MNSIQKADEGGVNSSALENASCPSLLKALVEKNICANIASASFLCKDFKSPGEFPSRKICAYVQI